MADSGSPPINNEQEISEKHAEIINGGKNVTKVLCSLCQSIVLCPEKAEYVKKQIPLPLMKQKKDCMEGDTIEYEDLSDYWLVHDIYTFENVGFTKSVGTKKYLACADCDVGPIGMMDTNQKSDIYVALDRVNHVH